MQRYLRALLVPLAIVAAPVTVAQETPDGDVAALRASLDQLRTEYEARIEELEQRVAAAEARASAASDQAQIATQAVQQQALQPVPASADRSGNAAFNPAIGVIFEGGAWAYQRDPDDYHIPGFPLGGEAGLASEGMALGETEINLSANVDDKFTARLTLPLAVEDGEVEVEIEEAWLETLTLPAGLSTRFGRFYSGIGYLNSRHSHNWDFADQPLPYQVFLGNQYLDDGIQLRWLAPTDLYVELGAEWLRGDRYPFGGARNSGAGAQSVFAHIGGDVDISSSWLAGLSYLRGKNAERASGEEDAPLLFDGDTDLVVADFVWKWAPQGNWKQRNLVLQAEYLWRREDGRYALEDGSVDYDAEQTGWYAQAVYQFMPQWRVGLRYDALSTDNPGPDFANTALALAGDDPRRYSFMVDWSNSEFSRLRLQYTRDETGPVDDNQIGLQYILSIGAHGAHTF